MPQGSDEGANSPLSPVSGAPTEVPTDCGRDDASREGDLAEEPTLLPVLPATVPDSLLASGVGEVPSPDLPTSAAGSWGKQRLLLDRAYRYLVDQGFGPLELASLDLDESPAMAPPASYGAESPLWGLVGRCPLLLATGGPRGG